MKRPARKVRVQQLQARNDGRREPYIVRWTITGLPPFSASFTHKKPADQFRSQLLLAASEGERFNLKTGQPVSWNAIDPIDVASFCKLYIDAERTTAKRLIQHRTAASYAEALTLFIEHSAPARAAKWNTEQRSAVRKWLLSDEALPTELERWMTCWSPLLEDLDAKALKSLDNRLRMKADGVTPAAENTAARQVGVIRCALDRAVTRGFMVENEWPAPDKGENARDGDEIEEEEPPAELHLTAAQMWQLGQGLVTHQPASRMYRAMTLALCFGCMRPSEVVALQVSDLTLPKEGWGEINLRRAWTGRGLEMKPPKKRRRRTIPIPPLLVEELRTWLITAGITEGSLFRTREGGIPMSNWNRTLAGGCRRTGLPQVTIYDLRHSCVTWLSETGVVIGEAARRMGHSPEVMLRHYLGTTENAAERANVLLTASLAGLGDKAT